MRRATVAVLVCLVSSPALAQSPEVVETELVELRNVAVANMNDREVIVGSVYNGTFNVPMRWSAKRGIDRFLGEVGGHAMAINDRGVIVGWLNNDGVLDGFVWSRRDGLQRLGLFVPTAINDKGVVVGACAPDGNFGQALPCVWEDGVFTHLGVMGGAFDVNDRGEVTGQVFTPSGGWSAFIWSREEGLTILPKGDNPDTIAAGHAINSRREVAGFVVNNGTTFTPAHWTSDGEIVLTPIGEGSLTQINDKSLAVGRYLIPLGPNQFGWFAFGLTATGRVIPLGEPIPLALTNKNVVLAVAEGGGELRVFLWRIRHVK
jgi:hypothetical protein